MEEPGLPLPAPALLAPPQEQPHWELQGLGSPHRQELLPLGQCLVQEVAHRPQAQEACNKVHAHNLDSRFCGTRKTGNILQKILPVRFHILLVIPYY